MVGRQRLHVVHVQRSPGDPVCREGVQQGGFVNYRAARGVDQVRRRLHQPELSGRHPAAAQVGERDVDGQDIGAREQPFPRDVGSPVCRGTLGVEGRSPGDHVHVEGPAVPGDQRAEPAHAQDAECLAAETFAVPRLPPPFAHLPVFPGNVPGQGQDQGPGELGGGVSARGQAPCRADQDAEPLGGVHVDIRLARPRAGDQLQARQPFQDLRRETRTLTRRYEHVEPGETVDERVLVQDGVVEELDRGVRQ